MSLSLTRAGGTNRSVLNVNRFGQSVGPISSIVSESKPISIDSCTRELDGTSVGVWYRQRTMGYVTRCFLWAVRSIVVQRFRWNEM
jgi:hypothetical protein